MTIAIIQARMGSTRLPGKVLKKIDGKELLAYQIDRVRESKELDKIIIATSTLEQDQAIVDFCINYGVDYFRGSENDVLSRYYECAKKYNPEIVVRLTGDCPLSDPKIIDNVINHFKNTDTDYTANTVPVESSRFPDGSDVEVFSMNALSKANDSITEEHFREHVTFQFWQTSEYSSNQFIQEKDFSKYRITVDYPEDFEVVEYIFQELANKNSFGHLEEIISIIDSNEQIKNKNGQYYFGQGWSQ